MACSTSLRVLAALLAVCMVQLNWQTVCANNVPYHPNYVYQANRYNNPMMTNYGAAGARRDSSRSLGIGGDTSTHGGGLGTGGAVANSGGAIDTSFADHGAGKGNPKVGFQYGGTVEGDHGDIDTIGRVQAEARGFGDGSLRLEEAADGKTKGGSSSRSLDTENKSSADGGDSSRGLAAIEIKHVVAGSNTAGQVTGTYVPGHVIPGKVIPDQVIPAKVIPGYKTDDILIPGYYINKPPVDDPKKSHPPPNDNQCSCRPCHPPLYPPPFPSTCQNQNIPHYPFSPFCNNIPYNIANKV